MQPNQNSQLPDINTIPGPEPVNNAPVFRDTPRKSGKGMMIGMICFALLAASGIAFGVWAMLDGNQKAEKLNAQITELNNQLSESNYVTEEQEGSIGSEGEGVETSDYVYIGEWGLKIAKPENWRDVIAGYSFSNDYPQAVDTFTIKQISDTETSNILITRIDGGLSCDEQEIGADVVCLEIGDDSYNIVFGETVSEDLSVFYSELDNYSEI